LGIDRRDREANVTSRQLDGEVEAPSAEFLLGDDAPVDADDDRLRSPRNAAGDAAEGDLVGCRGDQLGWRKRGQERSTATAA
jgi:hypothetical protein